MTNKAMEVAELQAMEFMQPESADKEVLDVVAKYSLQLRLDQQFVLNKLYIVSVDDRVPHNERQKITKFIENYQSLKRYSDTLPFITRAVESISLRKFWNEQSMQGKIQKSNN